MGLASRKTCFRLQPRQRVPPSVKYGNRPNLVHKHTGPLAFHWGADVHSPMPSPQRASMWLHLHPCAHTSARGMCIQALQTTIYLRENMHQACIIRATQLCMEKVHVRWGGVCMSAVEGTRWSHLPARQSQRVPCGPHVDPLCSVEWSSRQSGGLILGRGKGLCREGGLHSSL